jgi:hypothetical protein
MVGLGRFELPTSPLSGVRSNQLSYRPVLERCHCWNPVALTSASFVVKKGFEDWLNVLENYVLHDHRAMVDQAKKACIRIPAPAVRNGACRLDRIGIRQAPALRLLALQVSGPQSRKDTRCHHFSFRKEVIQPQVLLRLPCYDFTPIMNYTLDGCLLAVGSPASSATHFRDVTGGVYKARERIHRGILIRDY